MMKKLILISALLFTIIGCSQEEEPTPTKTEYRFVCKDIEPVARKDLFTLGNANVDYHLTINTDKGEIHFINKEPEKTFTSFDDLTFTEYFINASDEISAMSLYSWQFSFDKFSGRAKVSREPGNPKGKVNTYTCLEAPSLIE
ncbi:uncharacterized protein METZ01_LOCUS133880 [marine metagenome]|uniref:Uncharacterized protein n=1 Tax=marine metagenome TaxID=408172 RepID=A0A381YVG7_9ZZZZ